MRAVAKQKAAPGLELIEKPEPVTGPEEVLIQVKACSICGTDVHIYQWDEWSQRRIKPPLVLGHEVAGKVVSLGSHVQGISKGDYVSAESHIPCGQCVYCHSGRAHICQNYKILGIDRDGTFAEYLAIPQSVVWKNDPSIPPKFASIQEPLGNSVHVVMEANVAGKSVAVFGTGITGLFATAVARAVGAVEIFAIDQHEFKLNLAKKLGATRAINFRKEDSVKVLRDATGGLGVDVVLEMSGAQSAIDSGLKAVRKGGMFIAFGLPSKSVTVDLAEDIIFKGLQIKGITGRKIFETWDQMSYLLRAGKLDLSPIVTHEVGLNEFEHAMDLMINHPNETIKVVMYP